MKESIKLFYEELAKELLATFIDSKYKYSTIFDKPDIQSNDGVSFGVEVTQCLSSYNGAAEAFARMYFHKNNSSEDLEKKMNKMKINGLIMHDDINSWRAFLSTQGMFDVKAKKNKIAEDIKNKNIKKESGYKTFNENSLFLYCKFSYVIDDIRDIISLVDENEFDIIFFECTGSLFVYHKKDGNILSYNYFDNDLYFKLLKKLKTKYSSCFKQITINKK